MDDSGYIYITGAFSWTVNFNPNNKSPSDLSTLTYNEGEYDIVVLKLDPCGAFNDIFQIKSDSQTTLKVISIVLDKSYNIYLGVEFKGVIDMSPEDYDEDFILRSGIKKNYLLIKLDSQGKFSHVRDIK